MGWLRGFVLVGVVLGAVSVSAAEQSPNILFILADDLGYGDLGCYGQEVIQTPVLDKLAQQGLRFTDAYAGSTVCAPSRCALMTGFHTGHCRVRGNALVPLEPEDLTVAEVLRSAGYRTGIVGKWGLGEPATTGIPNAQGFDEWFGYLNQKRAHNYYPEFLWRNERQVRIGDNVAPDGVAIHKDQYSSDLFLAEAKAFLDNVHDQPFFLYFSVTPPHANNEAGGRLGNGMEVPDLGRYADESWPTPEKGRAAMISRFDADVGALLDHLQSLGLADNTLVIVTSDNGPHQEGRSSAKFFKSSGPLRGTKRDLYEGGIRVPMIAYWPGHTPSGKTCSVPVAFWDFLPTAADLAHVSLENQVDGRSIVGELRGEDSTEERPLYWEFHEGGFHQAVRLGHWKGVRRNRIDAPLEVYDLTDDLGEKDNMAGEHSEIVERIEGILASARTESKDFPVRKGVGKVSLRDRLRRTESHESSKE